MWEEGRLGTVLHTLAVPTTPPSFHPNAIVDFAAAHPSCCPTKKLPHTPRTSLHVSSPTLPHSPEAHMLAVEVKVNALPWWWGFVGVVVVVVETRRTMVEVRQRVVATSSACTTCLHIATPSS